MPVLAIDYGEKTLGIAVSDALGIAAHGLPPIRRTETGAELDALAAIVKEREITDIVLGLPKRMNDTLGQGASRVREFAKVLKSRLGLPVHFVDERLSTAYAHRLMEEAQVPTPRKRVKAHGFAAQVLLRTFLAQRTARGRSEPKDD